MPVQRANAKERAFKAMLSRDMVRLQDPSTGEFLHLSGKGCTKSVDYSWLGYQYQAETLRQRSAARGDPWPFRAIHRDETEDRGGPQG